MKLRTKKFIGAVFAMCLILFSTFSAQAAKKVVAIMPLENVSGYTQANVAQVMTEQLINVIHNSGQYTVIETTQRGAVMKQQGFENIVGSQEVDFGNQTNSDYTVVGKVIMATVTQNQTKNLIGALFGGGKNDALINLANGRKAKVELDVRFVDNKSGQVVFSKTFTGSKSGQNDAMALSGACKEAAENFLKELQGVNPMMARVAEIYGDKVYIDQGSASGLQKGETLIISREGAPIMVNGKIVDMRRDDICKAKVIEVNAEYSICKADKPTQVRKGDVVRRGSK